MLSVSFNIRIKDASFETQKYHLRAQQRDFNANSLIIANRIDQTVLLELRYNDTSFSYV